MDKSYKAFNITINTIKQAQIDAIEKAIDMARDYPADVAGYTKDEIITRIYGLKDLK